MAQERKKKKVARQDWKPHWSLWILHKAWMILFTGFKIAIGAAATVLMVCLICGFIFAGLLGNYLQEEILPEASQMSLDGLEMELNSQILYLDSDGQIQVQQQIYTDVNRKWANFEDIPKNLIHAAVAIEDKRFYEHQGVDWFTTIKACAGMFFGGSGAGGSSITQQLVKNTTHEDSYTVQRKVLEIFRAAQLEKKYNKDVIMETYLNLIYFGASNNGAKAAASYYFGKELQELTINECACLMSITNNPSLYEPYTNPTNNRTRRLNILHAMRDQGWITEEEHDEAVGQEMVGRYVLSLLRDNPDMSQEEYERIRKQGLVHESVWNEIMQDGVVTQEEYDHVMETCLILKSGIVQEDQWVKCQNESCDYQGTVKTLQGADGVYYCPKCGEEAEVGVDNSKSMYSYFTDTVIIDVARDLAAKEGFQWAELTEGAQKMYLQRIQRGGYNIYSTMNLEVQEIAESIYEDLSQIPRTYSSNQLQSAIVIIDNRTGDLAAVVGGVGEKSYLGFNRATQSTLQSGSSIKPLTVYAPAFESGAINPATVIKDLPLRYDNGSPWPANDNRRYSYSRTILSAVVSSVNAVATNTLDKIGLDYSFDFAKNKFGLSSLIDSYEDSNGKINSDIDYAPLSLGAQYNGVRVRDMAGGFATFANNGVYRKPRSYTKVYDSDGNIILDNQQESEQILSEKTVNYMNYCLVNAASSGTGWESGIRGITVGGKTGTTSSSKDRWFCGFTGYYTAAVWCGFDTPAVINLVNSGINNPATNLWQKVMAKVHQGKSDVSLYSTRGMTTVQVCLDSGMLATDACRNDPRGISRVASAMVYPEDAPTKKCDKHVEVEYCTEGHGVANEYCKLFAEAQESGAVTKKGLLKLTKKEIDEMMAAYKYYTDDFKKNLIDGFVYQIDDQGKDAVYNGLQGDLVQSPSAPYEVCKEHTRESWEAYQESQPKSNWWPW